jgi:hypothetical protein
VIEATRMFRLAVRVNPSDAEAHCNLGLILEQQRQYAEGVKWLARGHELGMKRKVWRYQSARWLEELRDKARLAARVPALLSGEEKPAGPDDALDVARFLHNAEGRPADAVRFYEEAFAGDPALGANPRTSQRYVAAVAAARTARPLALGWLRADLAAWAARLEKNPKTAAAEVKARMTKWLADERLAPVRGAALRKLPEGERKEWAAFWGDVEALARKAG